MATEAARERERLPHRRENTTVPVEAGGIEAYATLGFTDEGRPLEIFLRPRPGVKAGSPVEFLIDDIAVILSIAIQHGLSPEALAGSLGRNDDGSPSSIVGASLELFGEESP